MKGKWSDLKTSRVSGSCQLCRNLDTKWIEKQLWYNFTTIRNAASSDLNQQMLTFEDSNIQYNYSRCTWVASKLEYSVLERKQVTCALQ
jgi:hypothetical protein